MSRFPQRSIGALLSASLLVILLLIPVDSLSQTGTSTNETIPSGSLIIAMDNELQGSSGSGCSGPAFNLKAYGLAVRLLHNNIPLKWAIANKASKDATDFSANVTRISGQNCLTGPANRNFAGGPLIITQEYAALATPIINTFNNEIAVTNDHVRVYQTNAQITAPIRYTLTHKPLVAVGPVNGGWGGDPHTVLFNEAKLQGYFAPVQDIDIGTNSCYTMATQAHATSAPFYNAFKSFVENGGNFLIQCESITHYEQNQTPRFLSANGFDLFGASSQFPSRPAGTDSTNQIFPNPSMPFNQFVGAFPGDVGGAVSEWSVVGGFGNYWNGAASAVRNNNSGWTNTDIAAIGKIPTTTGGGGHVMTLGGHDYYRDTTPAGANLVRRNAQRMILNAVLIPARRPACNLTIPVVRGYKAVRMHTNTGPVTLSPGYTVEWTIQYINAGQAPVVNFQINDPLETPDLTFVSPLTMTLEGGAIATLNPSYNGIGVTNMLQPGAALPPGARITIRVKTVVNNYGEHLNQATATGTGLPDGGVRTDTTDNTPQPTVGGYSVHCTTNDCFSQVGYQTPSDSDPTGIALLNPSSAPVDIGGRVEDDASTGLARVSVTIVNPENGQSWTTMTNTFGYFRFEGIPSGEFYVVSVNSPRYYFPEPSIGISVSDSIFDLRFVSGTQQGKGLVKEVEVKASGKPGKW